MTTQGWLRLGTAIAGLLLVLMIVVIWRSAAADHARTQDIRGRAQETIERIEARARALENQAAAP
jgi:hypothetical protein